MNLSETLLASGEKREKGEKWSEGISHRPLFLFIYLSLPLTPSSVNAVNCSPPCPFCASVWFDRKGNPITSAFTGPRIIPNQFRILRTVATIAPTSSVPYNKSLTDWEKKGKDEVRVAARIAGPETNGSIMIGPTLPRDFPSCIIISPPPSRR